MHAWTAVITVLALSGCASVVTEPRAAEDGSYVVSVLRPRLSSDLIDSVDEAMAEARFKCAVVSGRPLVATAKVERSEGPFGGGRKTELRFSCA